MDMHNGSLRRSIGGKTVVAGNDMGQGLKKVVQEAIRQMERRLVPRAQ
jgi:hypothetical protein